MINITWLNHKKKNEFVRFKEYDWKKQNKIVYLTIDTHYKEGTVIPTLGNACRVLNLNVCRYFITIKGGNFINIIFETSLLNKISQTLLLKSETLF